MASYPNTVSRRDFITQGGTALAGLGLFATLPATYALGAAPQKKGDASSSDSLFTVPMDGGVYTLPPLPYAYNALEPYIDEETMRLHHDKHFAGYMNGLNAALKKLEEARVANAFPEISYWENQLAFNGAGYVLHTVFFQTMAPAGQQPSTTLTKALAEHFGSFDAFKAQFSSAAAAVQGSGWALLGYQPFGKKFLILQAEKHQNLTQWGVVPVLTLDVWEHAYYLKYQNRRKDYIENWWNVVNWSKVEERFMACTKLEQPLMG